MFKDLRIMSTTRNMRIAVAAVCLILGVSLATSESFAQATADVYIEQDGGPTLLTPGNDYTFSVFGQLANNGGLGMGAFGVRIEVSNTNVTFFQSTATLSTPWIGSSGAASGSPINVIDDITAANFFPPGPGAGGSPVELFDVVISVPIAAIPSTSSTITLLDATNTGDQGIVLEDTSQATTSYTPLVVTTIPEPGSLLVLGGLATGLLLRRKR